MQLTFYVVSMHTDATWQVTCRRQKHSRCQTQYPRPPKKSVAARRRQPSDQGHISLLACVLVRILAQPMAPSGGL